MYKGMCNRTLYNFIGEIMLTFKKRDRAATMVPSGILTSSTKRAKSSGWEFDITDAAGECSDGFSAVWAEVEITEAETADASLLVESFSSFDSSSPTDCWSTVREELNKYVKYNGSLIWSINWTVQTLRRWETCQRLYPCFERLVSVAFVVTFFEHHRSWEANNCW
jgi:hypothetical protein